jgi:GT2 family glycosyltransferase
VITALLLNYKRRDNLIKIISGLRQQTIPVEIFVWNNNPIDSTRFDADMQINSERNLMCSPRWLMAAFATTKYVFSLDDDLFIREPKLLENSIALLEESNIEALGYTGVKLREDLNYWRSKHISSNPKMDATVDIIKGRFILTTKMCVGKVDWINEYKATNYRIEDDIILSSKLKNKIIPSIYCNSFIDLPQPYALMKHSDHIRSRQLTTYKHFGGSL